MTTDSDGALLRAEARVPGRAEEEAREREAVAAEGRVEAASERAADARAEAAATGDGARSRATASRVAGRGTAGVTFGNAAKPPEGAEGRHDAASHHPAIHRDSGRQEK